MPWRAPQHPRRPEERPNRPDESPEVIRARRARAVAQGLWLGAIPDDLQRIPPDLATLAVQLSLRLRQKRADESGPESTGQLH